MFAACFARLSSWDWAILCIGVILGLVQLYAILEHWRGKKISFVQGLNRWQHGILAFIELLPVAGLLGTILGLMNTFHTFQASGKGPDLSRMASEFAPALTTTISAMLMMLFNLLLNAILSLLYQIHQSETEGGAA
jgi:hypothetical protein